MVKLSEKAMAAVQIASENAVITGGEVCTEHLLLGLLSVRDGVACRILNRSGITLQMLLSMFTPGAVCGSVTMSARANVAMTTAKQIAEELHSDFVDTEHLLFAVLNDPDSYCCRILESFGIDPEHVQWLAYNAIVENSGMKADKCLPDGAYGGGSPQSRFSPFDSRPDGASNGGSACADMGELSKFGVDLTQKARQGRLDPVIGRDKETQRVIQILCRRTKNNPVLVGEPGVGKSAIVDGLAIAIAEDNVPDPLKNKTVFSLDLSALVAGTRYRGDFEERLKNALSVIKQRGDIILFIDEIHTILKAGASEGGMDIANTIKPMLARGELTTIGATTIEEYRKQFEQDSALERRFQPVQVDEPSVADAIAILTGLRSKYEAHHGVAISDEAIAAAAVLSDRYVRDRFLPDKAVDVIDEAAACKRLAIKEFPARVSEVQKQLKEAQKTLKQLDDAGSKAQRDRVRSLIDELSSKLAEECRQQGDAFIVSEDDVAQVVSGWTGIPLNRLSDDETQKLSSLDEALKNRVIGQDKACEAVARAVRRARAGIKDPKRPIGSFLFLGPTGVGKTELAKSLASALFGSEEMLIRVDMSEYMDKSSASRLIGAAPGYVGFDEGGQLTEKVRRKPYSVVLFDEIEKGHEDIYNLLLQVLEDGILTDSKGRTVSFKNCVIILTSNIGAKEASAPSRATGFGAAAADSGQREAYMKALREYMKPEIINRLDEVIVFEKLTEENMRKIFDLMLASLSARLEEHGVRLKLTEAAKAQLTRDGFDPAYGARPLRRTLQRQVEDRLSEMMISGQLKDGDVVLVDSGSDGLKIEKV